MPAHGDHGAAARSCASGEPRALDGRAATAGCGRKVVDPSRSWSGCERRYDVISTRLVAGRTEVRVLADSAPARHASRRQPDLEDVYFATLLEHGIDTTAE